jgi:hypothetical protein
VHPTHEFSGPLNFAALPIGDVLQHRIERGWFFSSGDFVICLMRQQPGIVFHPSRIYTPDNTILQENQDCNRHNDDNIEISS